MRQWLPPGKTAAVCFSIDDIHPARSTDFYEAGGDMGKGALGNLEWLLDKHPKLKATLFTTADWREISPIPTRKLLASIPGLRDKVYLAKRWPKGKMRLDNHPEFVNYLKWLPRTDIALHGLYHCHKGVKIPVEFQQQNKQEFDGLLSEMIRIFKKAELDYVNGLCPPGWNAPAPLLDSMVGKGLNFIASARDINTPISKDALTNMSGMKDMSLIYPQLFHNNQLVHITSNFQATNTIDRAYDIIEKNGLLAVKAHIVKEAFGFIAKDGLDEIYKICLDELFTTLENKYGDSLWWTSMDEISKNILEEKE